MMKLVCSFICSQSWSYISWFSCTTPVWQLMRSKPRFVRSTSADPLSRSAALARQNSWLALNARNRWNIRKVVLRFQTSSPDDLTVCRTKTLPPWLLVQNLWLCTRRMNVASGLVCQLASKSCFAHKDHLRLKNIRQMQTVKWIMLLFLFAMKFVCLLSINQSNSIKNQLGSISTVTISIEAWISVIFSDAFTYDSWNKVVIIFVGGADAHMTMSLCHRP